MSKYPKTKLTLIYVDFYFGPNALTRPCNSIFASTKHAINPIEFTDAGSLPQLE